MAQECTSPAEPVNDLDVAVARFRFAVVFLEGACLDHPDWAQFYRRLLVTYTDDLVDTCERTVAA